MKNLYLGYFQQDARMGMHFFASSEDIVYAEIKRLYPYSQSANIKIEIILSGYRGIYEDYSNFPKLD
ncbi:hypothetical protein NIES2100_54400 [Calothrix sp. NIES-2100]|nr:hypothetical protein NIES2100_54400 [Calothrix sp. NIES-2100]